MNIMLGGIVLTLPESLLGPIKDFSQKLNGEEGSLYEAEFKKFLRKEPTWPLAPTTAVERIVENILRFVQTVAIPARTEKFVPKKRYTKDNREVQFGWIDPDFTDDFGDMTEGPTSGTTLRQYVLTRQSRFDLAMKEVAGEGFATRTTPGELYSMLEMQPRGPKSNTGLLLTNGYANLFEMVNRKGVSRLVNASWFVGSGGWSVYSYPLTSSDEWRDGLQLFSRDSRLPLAA